MDLIDQNSKFLSNFYGHFESVEKKEMRDLRKEIVVSFKKQIDKLCELSGWRQLQNVNIIIRLGPKILDEIVVSNGDYNKEKNKSKLTRNQKTQLKRDTKIREINKTGLDKPMSLQEQPDSTLKMIEELNDLRYKVKTINRVNDEIINQNQDVPQSVVDTIKECGMHREQVIKLHKTYSEVVQGMTEDEIKRKRKRIRDLKEARLRRSGNILQTGLGIIRSVRSVMYDPTPSNQMALRVHRRNRVEIDDPLDGSESSDRDVDSIWSDD